ncbi:hatching enzyme 1.2-like [Salminus brasiliensis]|uniref:hatching enzyme 1.2-like n=1 Tax=Salminus brasiliensis TaxID=930266 RepID=UPI003B83785A
MHLSVPLILLLLLGFSPAHSRSVKGTEKTGNNIVEDDFSVSAIIERANKNVGQTPGDPTIWFGDIVVADGLQNADQCTSREPGCKWLKNSDGNVYIPFIISNHYCPKEKSVIKDALKSFENSTCIRFIPRDKEEDYIHIQSLSGCFSTVGRRGGEQTLSLARRGCLYEHVIQHEVLHALGFRHEQNRRDRDEHVRIVYENIIPGKEHNFKKRNTNNLGTPYDYGSVMHYGRDAFSKNGQPTIVPIPDENVAVGHAKEMNANDILRVKKLYCG